MTYRIRIAFNYFWWSVIVILSILELIGAFGGYVRPSETISGKIAPLIVMAFPWVAILLIISSVVAAICRSSSWILGLVTLIVTMGPIMNVYPLHPFHSKSELHSDRSFTLLTFNTFSFQDFGDPDRPADEGCRTIDFLIERDADIVCLQEADGPIKAGLFRITEKQESALFNLYPYKLYVGEACIEILSKWPITQRNLPKIRVEGGIWSREAFCGVTIDTPDGHIAIASCHLESIGLTTEDKIAFQNLRGGKFSKEEFQDMRYSAITKLNTANRKRAIQIDSLIASIDSIEGPLIVCGDFNDVPLSYPMRALRKIGMKEVYPEVGNGKGATFHANRLNFRIDHIFYRGNLKPVWVKVFQNDLSDHYAVEAEFLMVE